MQRLIKRTIPNCPGSSTVGSEHAAIARHDGIHRLPLSLGLLSQHMDDSGRFEGVRTLVAFGSDALHQVKRGLVLAFNDTAYQSDRYTYGNQ